MSSFRWFGGRKEVPIGVFRDATIKGMVGVALVMQKHMRDELSKKGSGVSARTFVMRKRNGVGKRVRVNRTRSAPGEPPAAQTGVLRASWTIAPTPWIGSKEDATTRGFAYLENRGNKAILYTLGSNLVYARALEFGSPRTRLAPRPYARVVVAKMRGDVNRIISTVMQKYIRKTFR